MYPFQHNFEKNVLPTLSSNALFKLFKSLFGILKFHVFLFIVWWLNLFFVSFLTTKVKLWSDNPVIILKVLSTWSGLFVKIKSTCFRWSSYSWGPFTSCFRSKLLVTFFQLILTELLNSTEFFSLLATSIQIHTNTWGFNSHFQFTSILNYAQPWKFLKMTISYDKFVHENLMFDSELQFQKYSYIF